MSENLKKPKLVGSFIRQKREALSLSQRALGQLLTPPVTTQFISNLERGVTPLPLNHIPALTKALQVSEAEILSVMEKEYAMKVSGRLSQVDPSLTIQVNGVTGSSTALPAVAVAASDFDFIRALYDAYRQADPATRQTFANVCQSVLNMARK